MKIELTLEELKMICSGLESSRRDLLIEYTLSDIKPETLKNRLDALKNLVVGESSGSELAQAEESKVSVAFDGVYDPLLGKLIKLIKEEEKK